MEFLSESSIDVQNAGDLSLMTKLKKINNDTLTSTSQKDVDGFIKNMKRWGYKQSHDDGVTTFSKAGAKTITLSWDSGEDKATITVH